MAQGPVNLFPCPIICSLLDRAVDAPLSPGCGRAPRPAPKQAKKLRAICEANKREQESYTQKQQELEEAIEQVSAAGGRKWEAMGPKPETRLPLPPEAMPCFTAEASCNASGLMCGTQHITYLHPQQRRTKLH